MTCQHALCKGDGGCLVGRLGCRWSLVVICESIQPLYWGVQDPWVAWTSVEYGSNLLWGCANVDVCHIGLVLVIEHLHAIRFIWWGNTARPKICLRIRGINLKIHLICGIFERDIVWLRVLECLFSLLLIAEDQPGMVVNLW